MTKLDNVVFNATGYIVGELQQQTPNLYNLVTTNGTYEAKLTNELVDYIEETKQYSLLEGVNTFEVTPFTKERGYNRPQLGQVAHKPYLSFSIFKINPNKPVAQNTFDVRATCIKQFEPLDGEEWQPYVLMSLSSMSHYINSQKRDNVRKPRTLKLHGVLPSIDEEYGHTRDAIGNVFTLKAKLGEGANNQRLYIVPKSVEREIKMNKVNKAA